MTGRESGEHTNGLPSVTVRGKVIRPGRILRTLLGFGFLVRELLAPSDGNLETALFIGVALVLIDVKLFRELFPRKPRL